MGNNYSAFNETEANVFFKSIEMSNNGNLLLKSKGHKYYKREGSPGKYKYYYTREQYVKEKGIKEKEGKALKEGLKYLSDQGLLNKNKEPIALSEKNIREMHPNDRDLFVQATKSSIRIGESGNYLTEKQTSILKNNLQKLTGRRVSKAKWVHQELEKKRNQKEEKKTSGILDKVKNFFKEKMSIDFDKSYTEIGQPAKVSESVFADHLMEYFKNKEKWDKKLLSKKTSGEKKAGEKKKKDAGEADFLPEEKEGKIKSGKKSFNASLMKAIAKNFGQKSNFSERDSKVEGGKKEESKENKIEIKERVEKRSAQLNLQKIIENGGTANFADAKAVAEKINKHTNGRVVSGEGFVKMKEDIIEGLEEDDSKVEVGSEVIPVEMKASSMKDFAEKYSKVYKKIKEFVSKDTSRYMLSAIKYDKEKKRLEAIDGRKLIVINGVDLGNTETGTYRVGERKTTTGTEKEFSKMAEKFPNVDMFLKPIRNSTEMNVDGKEFISALKEMKPFIDPISNKIEFRNDNGKMTLSTFSDVNLPARKKYSKEKFGSYSEKTIEKNSGDIYEKFPVKEEKKEVKTNMLFPKDVDYDKFGLNHKLIDSIVKDKKGMKMKFNKDNENSPIQIESNNVNEVIMPMKLD